MIHRKTRVATRALFAMALLLSAGATEALAAKIYFTDNGLPETPGWVRRADLDGANVQTVLVTESGAFSLDLDLEAPKVYWSQGWLDPYTHPHPSVRRANVNGTNQETLFDLFNLTGIAVDSTGGKIYATSVGFEGGGMLDRWNLDGSGRENLASFEFGPHGLALDLSAARVYLAGASAIWRTDLDGSDLESVLPVDTLSHGVAVDPAALKVYWTTETGLYRGNMDGTGSEQLVEATASFAVTLDLVNGTVYWSQVLSADGDRILRADLDGTDVESVIDDVTCYGMAVDPLGVADVPAVSAWGSVGLVLLLLSVSTVIVLRRRQRRDVTR